MLKRPRFMMLLAAVDGVLQRLQIRWTNGETSVAALPRERRENAARSGDSVFGYFDEVVCKVSTHFAMVMVGDIRMAR